MSATDLPWTTSPQVSDEIETLNLKPEEFVNRRTGDECATHEGDDDVATCGSDVFKSQWAIPESRERVRPALQALTESQLGRLRAEGIDVDEYVREWTTETETHCPIHGTGVNTR